MTNRERKCADTVGTVLVPWAGHFQRYNNKYIFKIKYTEAALSSNTHKLFWFEISKKLIAVKNKSIVLLIIIFGTRSLRIDTHCDRPRSRFVPIGRVYPAMRRPSNTVQMMHGIVNATFKYDEPSRYLFPCELSFTFCDFDTVAVPMINTVVTHRRLAVTS